MSERSLAPNPGVTPYDPDAPRHRFLSDAIVAYGSVTRPEMKAALDEARNGRRYSEVLELGGRITEDELARIRAQHHRIDHVDLNVFEVDPAVAGMIPVETARRHNALPIALLEDGAVALAVHDPEGLTNMSELVAVLDERDVVLAVASRSQIERLVAELPDAPAVRAPKPPPSLANATLSERCTDLERRLAAAERLAADATARAVAAERAAKTATAAADIATEAMARMADERAAMEEIARTHAERFAAMADDLEACRRVLHSQGPPAGRRGVRRRAGV